MKKTIFIKNTAVLTVSALLLRFIGVIFKVWLAKLIGSEGIGLYQLVFSVFVFASAFASSGISTAVTRLCADEISAGNSTGIKKVLKNSIIITLIIAFISMAVLIFGAKPISKYILFDLRAEASIKILSFSLPFMGLCSCFRGYFFAERNASLPSFSLILEQIIRIAVVFAGVKFTVNKGISVTCAAIMFGDCLAEAGSCLFLYWLYLKKIKKFKTKNPEGVRKYNINAKIKEIALPITAGRYLNSALRTIENILIPKMLKLYGNSGKTALSQFGMIKGMALPLVFFPSTLLNSVSTLLIPELSEAVTKGYKFVVKSTIEKTLFITGLASTFFASLFFICGENIGVLIYGDRTVGILIKYLAPITPLMYLDSICDGMLKGLNQQKFTFKVCISDSVLRIIGIVFIVPKLGITGFLGIMYFSNCFSAVLNVFRLHQVGNAGFYWLRKSVFSLAFSSFSVLLFDTLLSSMFNLSILVYIILVSLLSFLLYALTATYIQKINLRELL